MVVAAAATIGCWVCPPFDIVWELCTVFPFAAFAVFPFGLPPFDLPLTAPLPAAVFSFRPLGLGGLFAKARLTMPPRRAHSGPATTAAARQSISMPSGRAGWDGGEGDETVEVVATVDEMGDMSEGASVRGFGDATGSMETEDSRASRSGARSALTDIRIAGTDADAGLW